MRDESSSANLPVQARGETVTTSPTLRQFQESAGGVSTAAFSTVNQGPEIYQARVRQNLYGPCQKDSASASSGVPRESSHKTCGEGQCQTTHRIAPHRVPHSGEHIPLSERPDIAGSGIQFLARFLRQVADSAGAFLSGCAHRIGRGFERFRRTLADAVCLIFR
jgi:hypothetical protein